MYYPFIVFMLAIPHSEPQFVRPLIPFENGVECLRALPLITAVELKKHEEDAYVMFVGCSHTLVTPS